LLSGWAYSELDVVDSALSMAKQLHRTFLESTQGEVSHQSPKTIAIVDTKAFVAFQTAWETFCAEMTRLLKGNDDADFVANLKRARTQSVAFSGTLDDANVKVLAAMDIGSFLSVFNSFCEPVASSQLRTLLDGVSAAYAAMFVERGVGKGTSAGTGMHITWVSQEEYATYTEYYQPLLSGATTDELPNYLVFLSTFYTTPTPDAQTATSPVCQNSLDPSRLPTDETELLIDPDIYRSSSGSNNTTEIRSQITRNVDYVLVEYGIDVTHLLSEGTRRRLHQTVRDNESRRRRLRETNQEHPPPRGRSRRQRSLLKHDPIHRSPRRGQEVEQGDLFLLYGGDVAVVHDGANVTATWDRIFYWLESGSIIEPAYVYDVGNGAKSIPVCYFSPSNPITKEDIPIGTEVDEAIVNNGCQEGFLTFSSSTGEDVGLYVYQGGGGGGITSSDASTVLSQIPSFIGGQVVPIVHIDFSVDGVQVNELLGGFETIIIEWGVFSDLVVYAVNETTTLAVFAANTVFMDVSAYDFDTSIFDYQIYPYTFLDVAVPSKDLSGTARSQVVRYGDKYFLLLLITAAATLVLFW
jgi:hypothetical protein